MRRDKIYEDLEFTNEFSVDDWNALNKLKFRKYFRNEKVFKKHKEIPRTEIINYIRFEKKSEYLKLFDWTFKLFKDCIKFDKQATIEILANSFNEISNTDLKWMTNVLTQPNSSQFLERDKISLLF